MQGNFYSPHTSYITLGNMGTSLFNGKLHWVSIGQCLANAYIVSPTLAQQGMLSGI